MRTTVKWFNVTKGYGFLENGAGPDIYVNAKSLRGAERINTGDLVEFECHVFDGKLVARHVKPLRGSQSSSNHQQPQSNHNNSYGNNSYGNNSYGNGNHGGGNRYGNGNDGNRQEFYPRSQQPRFVMQ